MDERLFMNRPLILTCCLLLTLASGCGDDSPAQGTEGGACYPNWTCNPGYLCVSGVCVRTPDGLGQPDMRAGDLYPHLGDQTVTDAPAPDAGVTADQGPDAASDFNFVPDAPVIPDGVTTTVCGDGVANQSSEQCDGADLGGSTCHSMPGFDFGTLSCNANCTLNTTQCRKYSFKTLAAGSFTMGSHATEACRDKADEDQHTVSLTSSIRAATTPVTQAQFNAVMNYNPSATPTCGDCPVDTVTWNEAAAYANALSTAAGLATCYSCAGSGPFVICGVKVAYIGAKIYTCPGYRLPTEAEWEYAYRAGGFTAYYNGANSLASCNSCSTADFYAGQIAWYCNNSTAGTMPVGRKQANAWGFYDMAGNVGEWTGDFYQASLGAGLVTNPAGPVTGTFRVRRGMTSDRMPHGLRAASREAVAAGYPGSQFSGFRVVQTLSSVPASCGNGVIETGESCDGKALNNKTCVTQGFTGGLLACSASCTFDTTNCIGTPLCGNNKIDTGEECDGTDLGKFTCVGKGYKGGTIGCTSACKYDLSKCTPVSFCGDGKVEGAEECDGSNFNSKTCKTEGFSGGVIACKSCKLDKTGCTGTPSLCGNAKIDASAGEQCDGALLGGFTCVGKGFKSGTLGCTTTCQHDTSKCVPVSFCGNGLIEGQETCDGSNLNLQTCKTLKYAGGVLACNAVTCQFNTAGCTGTPTLCGNGKIDAAAGEECDGTLLGGFTCVGKGYASGTLGCTTQCKHDTSKCVAVSFCGNGVIEGQETCDGAALNNQTCTNIGQGFTGGTLACGTTCQLNTSGCTGGSSTATCGDGVINGLDQCDGSQLGGYTCVGLNYTGGTLSCNTNCTFNTSSCTGGSSGGGSGPSFASIPAGSFSMGSPSSEPCRQLDGAQETQHTVTLSNAFQMSRHEITQGQFQSLMGYNPSFYKSCGTTCPVDTVSWHQAAAYANALSTANSLTPCYSCSGTQSGTQCTVATAYAGTGIYSCPGYRLPTEAEWEYAYRAGTTTAYYSGANSLASCKNCTTVETNAGNIGHYCANSTSAYNWVTTHPVGSKTANTWGLYDMAGNIQEWTHDQYVGNLGSAAATNPVTSPTSPWTARVMRGARVPYGWAYGMRAAYRWSQAAASANQGTGFRVVRRGSGGTTTASWFAMTSGTGNTLNGVWGTGTSNIYAVGNGGTILRYNGTAWTAIASPTTNNLHDVWGSSASDIYMVGANGTVLRYNGAAFTTISLGTSSTLFTDVYGTGATNVFVTAGATAYRFNGTSWVATSINSSTHAATGVIQMWGSGATNVYAALFMHGGSGGSCANALYRFNGTAWSQVSPGVCPHGLWGSAANDIHVVGTTGAKQGTAYWHSRYNGSSWSLTSLAGNQYGWARLAGTASNTIVGYYGSFSTRYNGTTWSSLSTGLTSSQALYDIWGHGKAFYAVGTGGIIRRYIAP